MNSDHCESRPWDKALIQSKLRAWFDRGKEQGHRYLLIWSCPDLTHTQISWQSCQREVCGGQAATTVHA